MAEDITYSTPFKHRVVGAGWRARVVRVTMHGRDGSTATALLPRHLADEMRSRGMNGHAALLFLQAHSIEPVEGDQREEQYCATQAAERTDEIEINADDVESDAPETRPIDQWHCGNGHLHMQAALLTVLHWRPSGTSALQELDDSFYEAGPVFCEQVIADLQKPADAVLMARLDLTKTDMDDWRDAVLFGAGPLGAYAPDPEGPFGGLIIDELADPRASAAVMTLARSRRDDSPPPIPPSAPPPPIVWGRRPDRAVQAVRLILIVTAAVFAFGMVWTRLA